MSTFKIGEKVVCVKESISLKKNEIYTISFLGIAPSGHEYVLLNEQQSSCPYGFHVWRFRKLDYQFAENLLAELTQSAKSEYQLN